MSATPGFERPFAHRADKLVDAVQIGIGELEMYQGSFSPGRHLRQPQLSSGAQNVVIDVAQRAHANRVMGGCG